MALTFEELEAVTITDLLVRAGLDVITVGLDNQPVRGSRGTTIIPNSSIDEVENEVNIGCMYKESFPELFLKNLEDWQIHDPKGKSIEDVREIHNQKGKK